MSNNNQAPQLQPRGQRKANRTVHALLRGTHHELPSQDIVSLPLVGPGNPVPPSSIQATVVFGQSRGVLLNPGKEGKHVRFIVRTPDGKEINLKAFVHKAARQVHHSHTDWPKAEEYLRGHTPSLHPGPLVQVHVEGQGWCSLKAWRSQLQSQRAAAAAAQQADEQAEAAMATPESSGLELDNDDGSQAPAILSSNGAPPAAPPAGTPPPGPIPAPRMAVPRDAAPALAGQPLRQEQGANPLPYNAAALPLTPVQGIRPSATPSSVQTPPQVLSTQTAGENSSDYSHGVEMVDIACGPDEPSRPPSKVRRVIVKTVASAGSAIKGGVSLFERWLLPEDPEDVS